MEPNTWKRQPDNRNFLSPIGFKFIVNKAPKVDFYSNYANIPAISLGVANYSRYGKNIDVPGDKMNFDDLRIRFLVDENLENYMEIHNWMTGLGFPYSLEQYSDLAATSTEPLSKDSSFYETSDGTLQILNSNFNTTAQVIYTQMFPVYLSTLDFDATNTDVNYFTAEATFKYTYYRIVDALGNDL